MDANISIDLYARKSGSPQGFSFTPAIQYQDHVVGTLIRIIFPPGFVLSPSVVMLGGNTMIIQDESATTGMELGPLPNTSFRQILPFAKGSSGIREPVPGFNNPVSRKPYRVGTFNGELDPPNYLTRCFELIITSNASVTTSIPNITQRLTFTISNVLTGQSHGAIPSPVDAGVQSIFAIQIYQIKPGQSGPSYTMTYYNNRINDIRLNTTLCFWFRSTFVGSSILSRSLSNRVLRRSSRTRNCADGAVPPMTDVHVLLVHSDGQHYAADVQSHLQTMGIFAAVDVFDANSATPLLSTLQPYSAVLVWADSPFGSDSNAGAEPVGNVLGQYWDAGGAVVVAFWANTDSYLKGQFGNGANGYMLIDGTTWFEYATQSDSLGTVLEPQSPLLDGVSSLSFGAAVRSMGAVINGGVVVAQWAGNGRELLVRGTKAGRSLVALNMYPVSSNAAGPYGWTGDGAQLISNALLYSTCIPCTAGSFASAGALHIEHLECGSQLCGWGLWIDGHWE